VFDEHQRQVYIAIMLLELLRKQIKTCGKIHAEISRDTGIEQAVLCRIDARRELQAETAEILLKYFGFQIVKKIRQKKGR